MSPTTAVADRGAWLGDTWHPGCLCQGMAQWCRRGMHKHCRCPHATSRSAEAVLTRSDGSYVIDAGTGRWLTLHLVPKPCRLHEVCPCDCHRKAAPKAAVALVQVALW